MMEAPLVMQRLQPLDKVLLLPEKYSPCMDLLARLKKIDKLEINDTIERDGKRKFVIDFYMTPHSKNRIPTNQNLHKINSNENRVSGLQRSDMRKERSVDDFIQLRAKLHRVTQTSHTDGSRNQCKYCIRAFSHVLWGKTQPTPSMLWFMDQKKIKQQLAIFLQEILALTILCKPCVAESCASQEQIPNLVSAFLFGE